MLKLKVKLYDFATQIPFSQRIIVVIRQAAFSPGFPTSERIMNIIQKSFNNSTNIV